MVKKKILYPSLAMSSWAKICLSSELDGVVPLEAEPPRHEKCHERAERCLCNFFGLG